MRLLLLPVLLLAACQQTPPTPGYAEDTTQVMIPDALAGAPGYLVRGFPPSHLAAADAYVDGSGLQRDFELRLRETLATRLPPDLLPVAHAWQARYLASAATRPAFARLLAAHLSEADLRGLATAGLPADTSGFGAKLAAIVAESRTLGGYLTERRSAELEAMLRSARPESSGPPQNGW